MLLTCNGDSARRAQVAKAVGAYAIWLLVSASLACPYLSAQEPALNVAVRASAAGIFSSGIVRKVPNTNGGDRATRLADAAALSIGLSVTTDDLPAAIRLTATRSVGASLELTEQHRRPCGDGCTGTSVEYEAAGDASVTLLAADVTWAPPVTWIVGPYLVAGMFRKTLAYDQSDLPSDIEPYFRSSDTAHGFRFGVGMTSRPQARVQLFAELLHQRGRSGAPRIPATGDFWRQRDVLLSAGLGIRVY